MKEYKIFHNTTGSVLLNQTNYTTFVLEHVTPGAYLFTVLAVNILGDGVEESTVITMPESTVVIMPGCKHLLINANF